MKSLNGIQAVVTGGASGVGRATVEALVAKGARVRVVSRSADKLEKVKQEVKGAIEIVQGNVTDSAVVARSLEGITPDLLVPTFISQSPGGHRTLQRLHAAGCRRRESPARPSP